MSKLAKYNHRSFFDGLGADIEVRILSFLVERSSIGSQYEHLYYNSRHYGKNIAPEILTSKRWILTVMTHWGRFACTICTEGLWDPCVYVLSTDIKTKIALAKQLQLVTRRETRHYRALRDQYYEAMNDASPTEEYVDIFAKNE